jgi:hypothetical protein
MKSDLSFQYWPQRQKQLLPTAPFLKLIALRTTILTGTLVWKNGSLIRRVIGGSRHHL